MRKIAAYPKPAYSDPNDLRLVQMVRAAASAQRDSVNLLGVPFDGAVLGRKGAAGGPSAIRNAMSGFSNYSMEWGTDPGGRGYSTSEMWGSRAERWRRRTRR